MNGRDMNDSMHGCASPPSTGAETNSASHSAHEANAPSC